MVQATSCPDAPALQRFLLGQTAEEESAPLEAHLLHCDRCLRAMRTLPADDPLISALQQGRASATPAPRSELLEKLRLRLREMEPLSRRQDTASGENTESAVPSSPFEAEGGRGPSLAPPQQPDEIGRLGGYRVLKELGRGGMGVVYQAEDLKLKRLVALKVMLPSLAADAAARRRFLREAQAMAAVHHDHVATIFQVDEDNGVPFLAMEFLQGMPLDQWLKGGRKPSIAQVLRMGREIAEGLAAAHERGLIHRDVKPGNIWLDSAHKGRVKILDFGLARVGTEDVHLTRTGAIVGTPAYMAPEQARGEKVDARSDLFSLGCVLYRLCTGAMPFAGDTTTALLMALALDHPKPVRDLNPDVPAALSDLVMRLLEKDPAKRPQSAREVVQAIQAIGLAPAGRAAGFIPAEESKPAAINPAARLETAARTETIAVRPSPAPASGGKKRRPWVLAAAAAGFLAMAVAVAIVIIIRDKDGNKVGEVKLEHGMTADVVNDPKKNDVAVAPIPPPDEAWVKLVASLPAAAQVEAVTAKLKERNPDIDGKLDWNSAEWLVLKTDDVADLTPLRALPRLTRLSIIGTNPAKSRFSDLSQLKSLPLTALSCQSRAVSDLSPLRGMKLTYLNIETTAVSDLSPLRGMKLTYLNIETTAVSDLSPLKGMPLTWLGCAQTRVSDLSVLRGMPLTYLECGQLPISDLSPLKDMKLQYLSCDYSQVADLSPLKGMPLTHLECQTSAVADLSPLKGMPLTWLGCSVTQVSDLSPLKDMKLTSLGIDLTRVTDLSPLKQMPLTELWCTRNPQLSDLSPLKGLPLKRLTCDFEPGRDTEILRSIKTLETINEKPAAEFWKDMNAKKP